MSIPDEALSVNHCDKGHPPPFENIDLLFIATGSDVIRIRQANKKYLFSLPVKLKRTRSIRSNGKDFCAVARELIILVSEAR
jgi:hypothetical protein